MSLPLRLAFLGSDAIALPLLDALAAAPAVARVAAVFTQPDRAVGRGQQVRPNAIKQWALAHGVAVHQPARVTDEARAALAASGVDAGLVMAYGHILRNEFIDTPRLGLLNLHTSLLPRHRGAAPIPAAIAAGERETGVTLMRIVLRLDAGPVADVRRVPIGPLDTAATIERRLAEACAPLVLDALPRLAAGTLEFAPQDESAATYCRKLRKEDGGLDFTAPAAVLAARINALHPWPGCAVELGGQAIKLGLADVPAGSNVLRDSAPGVVGGADEHGLLVATGEGVLRLRRLQRPGGRMLEAAEFLRGFAIAAGTRIESRAMASLTVSRS